METMKKQWVYSLVFCLFSLHGQEYAITYFGFSAADVKMDMGENQISFNVQTIGLIDFIWPTTNHYAVTYDKDHFGVVTFAKKIKQGSTKYTVSAEYDQGDSVLKYETHAPQRLPHIQSIFTMLARVQKESVEELDTKWFSMDHDGQLFSTRLLWADTSTITVADSRILCDHYRLDIKAEEDVTSLPEQSDYFMNNIIAPGLVRQLWVEKSGRQRIIQAAVKIYGINIVARIKNV